MKRTNVDPRKLKLKRKAIVQIEPKKLGTVTGGRSEKDRQCSGSDTRTCHGW